LLSKEREMKLLTKGLVALGVLSSVHATDLIVNLDSLDKCNFAESCKVADSGLVLSCSSGSMRTDSAGVYCANSNTVLAIQSQKFPITQMNYEWRSATFDYSTPGVVLAKNTSSSIGSTAVHDVQGYIKEIRVRRDSSTILVKKITLKKTIHGDLKGTATSLNDALSSTYFFVSEELKNFKNNIAKSHIGHTERFQKALKEGQEILNKKTKDGKYEFSILDWRVQENARLLVAFGSILDELLTEYDHVTTLKEAIDNMRTLVSELRDSYGWGRSLSGKVSKASSTLLDVVRLELQELGAIRMSLGDSVTSYTKLLKITGSLKAKVDAAKSGDMRAQREIFNFVDAWNEAGWQAELDKLVHAGPDVKNLVTPKLTMLLQAMESLEDLSEAGFEVPKLD